MATRNKPAEKRDREREREQQDRTPKPGNPFSATCVGLGNLDHPAKSSMRAQRLPTSTTLRSWAARHAHAHTSSSRGTTGTGGRGRLRQQLGKATTADGLGLRFFKGHRGDRRELQGETFGSHATRSSSNRCCHACPAPAAIIALSPRLFSASPTAARPRLETTEP
ncbi:hypothetical protein LZ30DRAFT_731942 [Colletotrichum cereale]|nr:hypothetical protein LZ30DRAFT_731942 [Colletotrichum cereale]